MLKRQFALPRSGEEHRAVAHADCAVQPMEGAANFDRNAGMSAPANGQTAGKWAENGVKPDSADADVTNLLGISTSAHLKAHCADLP